MRLENIVWDSRDPRRLGTFWATALDAEVMTDEDDLLEARMSWGDGLFLDLCFPRADDPSDSPARLHLNLRGGAHQAERVDDLLTLGATRVDNRLSEGPGVVLADVEGNAFCVVGDRDPYTGTGPIAALSLDSADPQRDADFWARLTGWSPYAGSEPACLRHPSGTGPVLELCAEPQAKSGKNALHLDIRAEQGDDGLVDTALRIGARRVDLPGAESMPWTVLADPSGNEFCILDPSPAA